MTKFPNGINVIGDIAGQYDTLVALLSYMPKDAYILSVGDNIDRGPKSKEVIEFFMDLDKQGKGTSLLGNHDHMMLSDVSDKGWYDRGTWIWNGGGKTLESFGYNIPQEVTDWISRLPRFKRVAFGNKKIFLSHSFWPGCQTLEEALDVNKYQRCSTPCNIIWSRDPPVRREEYQIAGHNSQWGCRKFEDSQGEFALCIDDSRNKRLTGVHIPSFEIYFQDYV